EAAGRAAVVVRGVGEVEPGLGLGPLELGDGRRVVGDRRRVRGAGGERPRLPRGAAAVLVELEERGRGQGGREERGGEEDDADMGGGNDGETWLTHDLSLVEAPP